MTTQRQLFDELIQISKRSRARRSRWKAFGKFLGNVFSSSLASVLAALLNGWFLMLAVGVIHDHWIPQCPTLGYWWAALIVYLLPFGPTAGKSKLEVKS